MRVCNRVREAWPRRYSFSVVAHIYIYIYICVKTHFFVCACVCVCVCVCVDTPETSLTHSCVASNNQCLKLQSLLVQQILLKPYILYFIVHTAAL